MTRGFCFLFILLFYRIHGHDPDENDCRISESSKKAGHSYITINKMVIDGVHNSTFNNLSFSDCQTMCINNFDCQVADYSTGTQVCKIYYSVKNLHPNLNHLIFNWKFCNMSMGTSSKQGVPGFWFYRVDYFRKTTDPLITFKASLRLCRKRCTEEQLCGGFNFQVKNNDCTMLVLWNDNLNDNIINLKWRTYYWVIQKPFTFKIDEKDASDCRNVITKPSPGKWVIKANPHIPKTRNLIIFQTRDFSLCYKTCEYYRNCKEVLFYFNESLCVLKAIFSESCTQKNYIHRTDIVVIQWICCEPNNQVVNKKPLLPSPGVTSCYKILKPEFVALVPFRCKYPPEDVHENCTTPGKTMSITCYQNQALLLVENKWHDYLEVYNGYQTFWIKNATAVNFAKAGSTSCQLYNATIPIDPTISIINKNEWYPTIKNTTYLSLKHPVKYIIVGTLRHQFCLCFQLLHCFEIIRRKQLYSNLPFHFLISGRGDIIGNLGWENQTYSFNDNFNAHSLFLGFLGDFQHNSPSILSMIAFRDIIGYGIKQGFVDKDYIILTDFDMNNSYKYFANIYNIIRSQAQYNGSLKASCRQISNLVLILNLCSSVVGIAMFVIFTNMLYSMAHSAGCIRLRKTAINYRLVKCQIHAFKDQFKSFLIQSHQFSDYVITDYEKINIRNTSFFWMVESINILPCFHCKEQFQETIRYFGATKKNINLNYLEKINHLCNKQSFCLISRAESVLCRTVIIILHLHPENLVYNLQNVLSCVISGRCVCFNYRIFGLDTELKQSKFKRLLC